MEVRKSSRNLSATVALGTVLLATAATLIQSIPNEALAQGAEARREALEEAKASGKLEAAKAKAKLAARKKTMKESARASAAQATRLTPDWNTRIDNEMKNYLETSFDFTTTNVVGKTFAQVITTSGSQSLRGDRKDCVSCHGDPATQPGAGRLVGVTRGNFCSRIPAFLNVNLPQSNDGHKPRELKHFLGAWRSRFCQ